MTRHKFEALVERALRRLPGRFRTRLANVAVVVEDWPDEETLADLGIEPPDTLFGLYRGVDITRRHSGYGNVLPDTITIYQGPIEDEAEGHPACDGRNRARDRHHRCWDTSLRPDDETMHRIEDVELEG
jgi:predicted Zn-dependent protease with MMP-like domain